jgi:hypothetical protein
MNRQTPMHPEHTKLIHTLEEGDACVTCSEQTQDCCGLQVKRWCVFLLMTTIAGVFIVGLMALYIVLYSAQFTVCRLTYSDDAIISEAKMQSWVNRYDWTLSVPSYDPWRRTCVCKGFEDIDPKNLSGTDEVLAWIAPGDLVSLSDEKKISPLPIDFVTQYRTVYGEADHVKVCIPHSNVVDLWNLMDDAQGDGRHCHSTKGDGSTDVERFYLGWDGALYCSDYCWTVSAQVQCAITFNNTIYCYQYSNSWQRHNPCFSGIGAVGNCPFSVLGNGVCDQSNLCTQTNPMNLNWC